MDIETALADVGGDGAKCLITRLEESTGRMVRICTIDASQVSQEFIQSSFGGGTYRGRFRAVGGSWGKQFTVHIDRRIPAKLPAWVTGTPAASTNGNGQPAGADEDQEFKNLYKLRVLDLIKESDELRARTSEMMQRSSDMQMVAMQKMMDATTAMLTAVTKTPAAPPAPAGPTFADILNAQANARKETLEMVTLLKGGTADAPTIDKTLALMAKLREASGSFMDEGGGSGEGSGFSGLLGKLAEALLPALAGMLQGRGVPLEPAPAPPPSAEPPRIAPVAPVASVAAQTPTPEPSVPLWLTLAKGSLLEAAEEGRDPVDVAVSLMTLAPRRSHGAIREAVMREDAVEALVAVAPEFAAYRTWLGECVTALRDEFNPPAPDGPETPGAAEP